MVAPPANLQAPLWQLLQATSGVAQAVHQGRSMTAAIEQVPKELRPGVQALSFQAMRWWGRAVAIRKQLARKAPPAKADALLCTALPCHGAMTWRRMQFTPWSIKLWRPHAATKTCEAKRLL